jgi:oligopeptide/dipeptide ABC transporter ATP-binding protein
MSELLLETRQLTVCFPGPYADLRTGRRRRQWLYAVDRVNLGVHRGEILGLVGESGSGKSTFARAIVGVEPLTSGDIRYSGALRIDARRLRADRKIQMVFQDPYSSLNPRMSVAQVLRELLRVNKMVPKRATASRMAELLNLVGLPTRVLHCYPRQLSGGERQRVAIARALAVEPEILVADEPTSALDVSVQATILNLLASLRSQLGLTVLFISHDLAVVKHITDRVAIMYAGRIVETAPTNVLFQQPQHPFTRKLLAAVPRVNVPPDESQLLPVDEAQSAFGRVCGCVFRNRCSLAIDACEITEPVLAATQASEQHRVACHVVGETMGDG